MQYQKEEVRARILASALNEFEKFGFKGAKMRRIAWSAKMATGNLYRYFRSKDEIFDEIVKAGYINISALVDETTGLEVYNRGDVKLLASFLTAGIMKIYRGYGRELLVIADKSAGSKHEDFLRVLCEMAFERIKSAFCFDLKDTDGILIQVLVSGFVEGLFFILRSVKEADRLEELVNRMLVLYFDDIENRLSRR